MAAQRWFAGKGRTWQVAGTATVGELAPGVRIDTVTVIDPEHRRIVGLAPEDDALGNLAQGHAQRVGSLLRESG